MTKRINKLASILKHTENPSTADVWDAAAHAYNERPFDPRTNRAALHFFIEGFGLMAAQIVSIGYESGAPGMFLLRMNLFSDGAFCDTVDSFYDANQRVGHVKPQEG